MDAYEATKIVFERIQNLDPQNASKIMGFLLIQDHGEKEMIRLAFGSESSLQAVIFRVKKELGLVSPNTPLGNPSSSPFSNPRGDFNFQSSSTNWNSSASSAAAAAGGLLDFHSPDDFVTGSNGNGEIDLLDELHLHNQLSFLNDGGASQIGGKSSSDLFYHELASSPSRNDAVFFSGGGGGGGGGGFAAAHRRSFSVSDDDLNLGFGWKPCLFYARGYCKNGTTCRFVHGGGGGDLAGDEHLISSPNYSPILQQLQTDNNNSPRSLMMDKFAGIRELGMNGLTSPGSSRQIYLTFPAESTFKEEDVSNYFSNFGPVQDVRIPYQQKRMFGFVTFEYPETVRLILAKGNPHFVCDARVLVKPYKEKGKIPDKNRKQMERGEFGVCGSPTAVDARDPYDLQLGARTFYNTQDMLWRKKLEDQVDLQQAIELQSRRLMNLRLLDIKRNSHHRTLSTGSLNVSSPTYSPTFFSRNYFAHTTPETTQEIGDEDSSIEKESSNGVDNVAVADGGERFEREHDLPDSPFASVGSTPMFPMSSSPSKAATDMAPFKSCYFQAPRVASGHETVGM